ncbi:hypothetical protein ACN2WE_04345 [Streptomyces sp. cg28]|uniref:hypothetical protein n=1 Tax=Streptomyces sp. cg28 TaxID=3403457 RepID=UPI003B220185
MSGDVPADLVAEDHRGAVFAPWPGWPPPNTETAEVPTTYRPGTASTSARCERWRPAVRALADSAHAAPAASWAGRTAGSQKDQKESPYQ